MRWRADTHRAPTARVLIALAAIVVGLFGEWVSYGPNDLRHLIPDLLTGWALVGCGLLALLIRPVGRWGWLLVSAGLAWFIANFSVGMPGAIASVATAGAFVYRGFLAHAVLGYPGGGLATRVAMVGAAAGYIAAAVPAVWLDDRSTVVLVGMFAGVLLVDWRVASRRRRRERLPATLSGLAIAVVVGASSIVPSAVRGGGAIDFPLFRIATRPTPRTPACQ